jgi:hypothetical protein
MVPCPSVGGFGHRARSVKLRLRRPGGSSSDQQAYDGQAGVRARPRMRPHACRRRRLPLSINRPRSRSATPASRAAPCSPRARRGCAPACGDHRSGVFGRPSVRVAAEACRRLAPRQRSRAPTCTPKAAPPSQRVTPRAPSPWPPRRNLLTDGPDFPRSSRSADGCSGRSKRPPAHRGGQLPPGEGILQRPARSMITPKPRLNHDGG